MEVPLHLRDAVREVERHVVHLRGDHAGRCQVSYRWAELGLQNRLGYGDVSWLAEQVGLAERKG